MTTSRKLIDSAFESNVTGFRAELSDILQDKITSALQDKKVELASNILTKESRTQEVHKGITQSGQHGWFTGNTLAWSLSKEDHDKPHEWHKRAAAALGFDYKERDKPDPKTVEKEDGTEVYESYDDDYDDYHSRVNRFSDPGGNSALHVADRNNPRVHDCPTCGEHNKLTHKDVRAGYQCDSCADAAEGGQQW